MMSLIERWTEYKRRAVINDSMVELVDSTINELRGSCRCADEVRCDRLAEIERLTIDVERWKSIASQIESDWIPANRKLSADVAKLRHEADGLLIRNEKLEKAGNIPYMSAPERIGDEWVLVKQRHLISLDEAIAEVNDENG